ncbi:hypothetical protein Sjap_004917 [Stephania japonica]|uniref:Uncharacterized protein n=1 Tax=Stephania japonica TaxID=461633 RepID=A0AAP0PJJ3_9MAGN
MALEQLLKKNKEVLLFYCVESEALAWKVTLLSDSIKLHSINWRYHLPTIRKNPIEIRETVHIEPKREMIEIRIRGKCRFSNSLTLITQPRKVIKDIEGCDLKYLVPLERFYFGDHVLPCFETGIPLLKRRLHQLPDAENLEKRDGTPKDQLSSIKQTLKELQCKREERMKEFCDIHSQIIQVHEALHGSVVDKHIVDDKDLTTKRLRELKLVRQGLQSENAARSAGVPVILDAVGMDGLIPVDLLTNVDIFSPNETELERLTGMPSESFE